MLPLLNNHKTPKWHLYTTLTKNDTNTCYSQFVVIVTSSFNLTMRMFLFLLRLILQFEDAHFLLLAKQICLICTVPVKTLDTLSHVNVCMHQSEEYNHLFLIVFFYTFTISIHKITVSPCVLSQVSQFNRLL